MRPSALLRRCASPSWPPTQASDVKATEVKTDREGKKKEKKRGKKKAASAMKLST